MSDDATTTLYLRGVANDTKAQFMEQAKARGMTPAGWLKMLVDLGRRLKVEGVLEE